MQIRHKIFHLKLLLSWNSTRVAKKVCVASHNNHPTSLASSWDISFLKSLVQQDPKGSNKVAHHFILDVYVSPNRKYVNLSIIYYIADLSFFMSQDDAYFRIHQNDPTSLWGRVLSLPLPFSRFRWKWKSSSLFSCLGLETREALWVWEVKLGKTCVLAILISQLCHNAHASWHWLLQND